MDSGLFYFTVAATESFLRDAVGSPTVSFDADSDGHNRGLGAGVGGPAISQKYTAQREFACSVIDPSPPHRGEGFFCCLI